MIRFAGPRDHRVERAGRRGRPVRDHQRLRRHRPGVHRRPRQRPDRRRHLVGRPSPTDVEALAPAGDGEVLGRRHRRQPRRARRRSSVLAGAGRRAATATSTCRRTSWSTPTGPRDAESLLADPATGRLYVVSKGVFGGAVYAAPERLSARRPNRLEEVGPVLRHRHRRRRSSPTGGTSIVRNYAEAAVYSWPGLERGRRASGCPTRSRARASPSPPTARSTPPPRGCTRRCCGSRCRPPYAGDGAAHRPDAADADAEPDAEPTPPPGTREGRELPEQAPAAVSLGLGARRAPRARDRGRARPRPAPTVGRWAVAVPCCGTRCGEAARAEEPGADL